MLVLVLAGEEIRIERNRALEIERAAIQHLGDRHVAALGAMDAREAVDRPDARLDLFQLLRGNQVGLVQHDHVGEGDLRLGLLAVIEPCQQMLCIDDGDDRVEPRLLAHGLVDEEGLRDGRRIGEARWSR